jgi:4-carboxymuconolactone decarboxylase
MTTAARQKSILPALDEATRLLVRLSAVIASGTETDVRSALATASPTVSPEWIEELVLQSYLFAGFPRSLNAMREWRRLAGGGNAGGGRREAGGGQANGGWDLTTSERDVAIWRAKGEETCRRVYGEMYERLRVNIRELHPDLDEWMIVEGYGKVLSRPGLDLARRELCIVAACAASGQDRQLHSHLHGALNVGCAPSVVDDVLEELGPMLGAERAKSVALLWARVRRQEGDGGRRKAGSEQRRNG